VTDIERRVVDRPVELRAAPEGGSGPGILSGYGAVFNSTSRDLGGWFEEIDPGAAGEPVDGGALDLTLHTRVIARAEHDSRLLLGTTDARTLRLFVDEIGVRYEVDLPDTTAGRDVAVLAARGDYAHSSFAFNLRTLDDVEWREDRDGRLIRRVMRMTIHDVAPVADPAYWGATTQLQRSLDEIRRSLQPAPAEPPAAGEYETAAATRLRSIEARIAAHAAVGTRPRRRGI
jgi:HK97 family phage prohead protease